MALAGSSQTETHVHSCNATQLTNVFSRSNEVPQHLSGLQLYGQTKVSHLESQVALGTQEDVLWLEGGKEGGREKEGEREGGKEERREGGKEGERERGREGKRERGKEGERERGRGRGTDVTVMSCDAWHARNGVKEGRACGQVQLGREQVKQALSPHRHRGTRYTKDTHTDRQTDRQARLYTYTYTHSQGIDVSALFFRMQGKWHEMFATTQTVETSSHPQSAVLAYLHTLTHSLSSQKRQL